jgi:cysteinyl-tRNA synthetase
MALKLYNTLGRKIETFSPLSKKEVKMYSCGPTVYWYAHIGNLRTYIFNDLLKRALTFLGYKVNQVMNITDIDDKTIRGSVKEGLKLKDFTRKYEKIFFEDLENLNIIKPTHTLRATENINEMVLLIKTLIEKGYAYKAEDGIYFSIKKFEDYGKLALLDKIKTTKERINSDSYDKENVNDFALWKFWREEDGEVFWDTEIGKGRPGWHIECSAMSMKILGKSLDIHTGGIDLIFPHHTNEIAQSEAATGKQFVKYWVHGAFLNMKEGKMSKSLGNIFTLKDLEEKGFSPMSYRYLCLTTHYRSLLLFSEENLKNAKISYDKLRNIVLSFSDDGKENKDYLEEFKKNIEDDLNIPASIQVLWKLVRDGQAVGKFRTIKKMDEIFGLRLFEKEKTIVPEYIEKMAEERAKAKKKKEWKKADELREKIRQEGFVIDDNSEGWEIKKVYI